MVPRIEFIAVSVVTLGPCLLIIIGWLSLFRRSDDVVALVVATIIGLILCAFLLLIWLGYVLCADGNRGGFQGPPME